MTCNNSNPDDRYINEQEHRDVTHLWKKAIEKLSSSKINLQQKFLQDETNRRDHGKAGNFSYQQSCDLESQPCDEKKRAESEALQKKIAKGKSMTKIKSPLQKFDEVVTREMTNRRMSEDGGMPSFEGSKQWSAMQFSGGKISDFGGRSKISVENKVSRGVLYSVEKDVKSGDPSDCQNPALLDAIDKLAQAQAFCRFDAAVKAAEAATASVPPEKAEEVAVACAKDYQAEIVDVINEKFSLPEEKKPIEVIGYIGVTKLKDNA